jgi:hypothetical protein
MDSAVLTATGADKMNMNTTVYAIKHGEIIECTLGDFLHLVKAANATEQEKINEILDSPDALIFPEFEDAEEYLAQVLAG